MVEQDDNKFIFVFHNNKSVKTIADFIEYHHIYGITADELFELNRLDILFQMSANELSAYQEKHGLNDFPTSSDLNVDMVLPRPCRIRINAKNVSAELAIVGTNQQTGDYDFVTFAAEQIDEIFQDSGYVLENYIKRDNEVRVIGWFKSQYYYFINNQGGVNYNLADFIDISAFVASMQTNVTRNGGNFTLRLPVIASTYVGNQFDNTSTTFQTVSRDDNKLFWYNNGHDFYTKNNMDVSHNNNFFNTLISPNDLLFLSFDKLELESLDVTGRPTATINVSTDLSGQTYDMIGLVDGVSTVTDESGAVQYVEVYGRDVMKLLIDDGSFFFNVSTAAQASDVFKNESTALQGDITDADQLNNGYNNPFMRLRRPSRELDIFINRPNQTIEYILKGVFSQLANVEVVPDYVFQSWGDNRTKFISLFPQKTETNK